MRDLFLILFNIILLGVALSAGLMFLLMIIGIATLAALYLWVRSLFTRDKVFDAPPSASPHVIEVEYQDITRD